MLIEGKENSTTAAIMKRTFHFILFSKSPQKSLFDYFIKIFIDLAQNL